MSSRNETIAKWVEKADEDLGTAILINSNLPQYKDTIAFHCQQAVEKYIKAWMLSENLEIKKTHDLVYLLELINVKRIVEAEWFEKAEQLDDYGVEVRYPDSTINLSDSDIEDAIRITNEFRAFVIPKLNLI